MSYDSKYMEVMIQFIGGQQQSFRSVKGYIRYWFIGVGVEMGDQFFSIIVFIYIELKQRQRRYYLYDVNRKFDKFCRKGDKLCKRKIIAVFICSELNVFYGKMNKFYRDRIK